MKKLIVLAALVLVGSNATESYAQKIKLWKNGTSIYQTYVENVDSITFVEDKSANLQMADLVGTWKIIYSRGQEKDATSGSVRTWSEDVEVESNCWVFTDDGKMMFMEYSPVNYTQPAKPGMWDEDGKADFAIENGVFKVKNSTNLTARILSVYDDEMEIEYSFVSDGNGVIRTYTDTAKRINKDCNVLRTENNLTATQPEALPYIYKEDVVGTWLISHEKSLVDSKDGKEKTNENVEAEQNYYVIFPDNRLGFIEYSSLSGKWHLDGHEYIPYSYSDGKMSFTYGRIIDINKNSVRIYQEYVNDHGDTEIIIYTLRRVSTATDYIQYDE